MKAILIKLALFLSFAIFCQHSHAARYYFSSSGDDSRSAAQAQNSSTPWKSINKLNSIFSSLKPGDEILFKRGDVFYGTIHITKSGAQGNPIVFGAYGDGPKPIITSLVNLTNWTHIGNGIYETPHQSFGNTVNIVLINNEPHEIGRHPNSDAPNKGYLTFKSTNGYNNITSDGLSGNWGGGEVVIRNSHWTIDSYKIQSHVGNIISFIQSAVSYNFKEGFGYFVKNHPNTLDKYGEWYYDPGAQKLRVHFGSSSPSSLSVQAGALDHLVTNSIGSSFVRFDNLHFKGANKNAFHLFRSNSLEVKNCDIDFSGENGIYLQDSPHSKIEDSKITYSQNNGIEYQGNNPNAIIRNNVIENTGIFSSMGKNGPGNGVAISTESDNNLIEYNKIINTGYIGIRFGGNSSVVKNNLIDNFCLTKDDGAAVYSWTGSSNTNHHGRKITGNIILNGIGAIEGTPAAFSQVEGIYLDDNVSGVDIEGNTIGHVAGKGIYIHNSRSINIKNNTLFNNGVQLRLVHDFLGNPVRNITSTGNIFFANGSDQSTMTIGTVKNDVKEMGSFDNNYHVRPTNEHEVIFVQNLDNSGKRVSNYYDLQQWKDVSGKDQTSKSSPVKIPAYNIISEEKTNQYPNGTYDNEKMATSGIHGNNSGLSWISGGKLDGGTLEVKNNGPSSFVTMAAGSLKKSTHYILRFSAMSSQDITIKALLIQNSPPYGEIGKKATFKFTPKRGEYEAVFPIDVAEPNASIRFITDNNQGTTYWLDNVALHEAKVEEVDPDDFIRFEYNSTNANKTISLDGTYVDVKNTSYSGNITLLPYSSIALIKTSDDTPEKEPNKAPTIVISDPINNATYSESENLEIKVDVKDEDGEISKVEFFNDNQLLGTVNSSPYTFMWKNVEKGEHTITAKATDNESAVSTSAPIKVSVGSISSGENDNNDGQSLPENSVPMYLNVGSSENVVYDGQTFVGDSKYPTYYNSRNIYTNTTASLEQLFQSERNASNLQFKVPVPNGTYTVKTYHNELWWGKRDGQSAYAGRRVFNISLEGKEVRTNFDLFKDASNQYSILVFENIEVTDGELNINMVASTDRATLSGIAILPGAESIDEVKPPTLGDFEEGNEDAATPGIYINAGSPVNVEYDNQIFLGDQSFPSYFNSPYTFIDKNASPDLLFQTERLSLPDNSASLEYSIPVENGVYTVKTYHNELWFGKKGPSEEPGRRVFDILIEGKLAKDDFDPFIENSNRQIVLTFQNIEVKDGKLDIKLLASKNRGSISGIAVLKEDGPKQIAAKTSVSPPPYSAFYNTGSGTEVTYNGESFKGDNNLDSLYNQSFTLTERTASTDPLFQSERTAINLKYAIPVPNGTYTVETYHNELWWGRKGGSAYGGRRVFDIILEGNVVKENFDLFSESSNKPTTLTFENIEVNDGILNLELDASKDRGTISGIAIYSSTSNSSGANLRIMSTSDASDEEVEPITIEEIKLYPNPASEIVYLSLNRETDVNDILIYDMNGQLIQHLNPQILLSNSGEYAIPLTNIPAGIYLVNLVGKTEMIDQIRLIVK